MAKDGTQAARQTLPSTSSSESFLTETSETELAAANRRLRSVFEVGMHSAREMC